jgi:hypothetical protein
MEFVMNARSSFAPWISLGALVIASGAAVAADPAATERTRAEVVTETLAARAAGTLTPAGESPAPRQSQAFAPSTVSRSELKSEVLAARENGTLIPAGEGVEFAAARPASYSTVSRAEVKASVIAARKAGDLVPAGEGPDTEYHARANVPSRVRTALGGSTGAQTVNR